MWVSYFFHPFIMFRFTFITGLTLFALLGVSVGAAHASENYKPFVGNSLQGTARTFVGPRPSPRSLETERYAREQLDDLVRRSRQALLGVHDRQPNRPDF